MEVESFLALVSSAYDVNGGRQGDVALNIWFEPLGASARRDDIQSDYVMC